MRPVLEHPPAAQQRVVRVRRQAAAAAREHEALRAVDDRDGVDLDAAEPLDAGDELVAARPAPARREALRRDGMAPRGFERDLPHWHYACASHSSTSARVSTPIGVLPSATSTAGLDCRSW